MKKKLMVTWTLLAAILLAACGSQPQPGASQGNAPGGAQGGGKNVAVYAYTYPPIVDPDPSSCFDMTIATLLNVYDTLLRYDPDTDTVQYQLCDSYEFSEDAMTWTFHIREGAKFHDGTPVNAEAVKYSFERTIEKGLGASYIWAPVDHFEVTDEYTLVAHLSYAAAMDLVVSSPYAAYVMSPTTMKEKGDDWIAAGNEAGSGPYYIESNTVGKQVVLAKFDDYWGGWKENQFDRVVIQNVSEASSRRLMLESGDADVVSALPAEDVDALSGNKDITIVKQSSFENLFVTMNCVYGPLSDLNVRKAMSYAFPYDDVIQYALGGNGAKSTGPVPAGLWGHSEEGEVDSYHYDIEKAKEYLSQSSYPEGGFTLSLTYVTGIEEQRKLAELFQNELRKLNITLDIQPMTADMYTTRGQSERPEDRQDMAILVWYPDVPSPYTFFYTFYHQQDPISFNWTYYANDELDALIDQADILSATDRGQSIELYRQAQQIIYDDAPAIIAYDLNNVHCYRTSFQGFESNPAYPYTVFFYECTRAAG